MEIADLAERIIHDIHVVFSREPNVDEFDIIPVFESQNKSPVVNVGTKIGLEAWCVKFLYLHVYTRLMEWRERKLKIDDNLVIQWSEILLLLNPDVTTAWNIRKELISLGKISASDELRLCRLLLTRKPKSPEVFIHRRWSLIRMLNDLQFSDCDVKEHIIADELQLCTVAASCYPNNYCAWSHRQWVHSMLTVKCQTNTILLQELKWSETYVRQHVSDHSGFQFRQYLLKTILDHLMKSTNNSVSWLEPETLRNSDAESNNDTFQGSIIANLLFSEVNLIRGLICDFPGHETLWYHSRFVIHSLHLLQLINLDFTVPSGPICKRTRTESSNAVDINMKHADLTNSVHVAKLEDELNFANKILADDPLQHYADRHKRWLAKEFGFEL